MPPQERLWKEAVAYQLAHEAMGFKRSSLRHVQTVETGRYPGLGKVRADGKPDFPDRVVKPEALANGNKGELFAQLALHQPETTM